MSKLGDDIRKVETWFKRAFITVENDAEKVAVFITAQLEPEIEKLLADGTIFAAEKVVDVITKSNVGDLIGAAIIKELPVITKVAHDVQKVVVGWPIFKTLFAAQLAMILNTYKQNPSAPKIQAFIAGVEEAFKDAVAGIEMIVETNP